MDAKIRKAARKHVTEDGVVDAGKSPRRGIQSIEIGFAILEVLRMAAGPIPLRTIAARCEMPVANVHNYLVSFQNVGVVVQEPDTGFYGLGQYAIKLGTAALQQFDVHKVARPAMAELGALTGLSVFLGVWGNKGPTIVYRVECAQRPSLWELRVGSVLPLLTSALGRNFLAHLPQHVTAAMVKEELAQQKRSTDFHGTNVPKTLTQVYALAAHTRENGFSFCHGFLPGVTTMSAPVFDQFGNIIAAVTIMGPMTELVDDPNSEAARLLKKCSISVSNAAGWAESSRTDA
ncbi:IclR family transcriptional regulator [Pandoraea eparura]|nr:IclR family transcriptional regulator [Pandoraea eparura]